MDKENINEGLDIELPYFDEKGKQIKEFAVLKIFHFKGVNDQGRGRKNYYMYKWVKLKEIKGIKYWAALHLTNGSGDYFTLRCIADDKRILKGTEIVQSY